MRISDWSSDVCSSDLSDGARARLRASNVNGAYWRFSMPTEHTPNCSIAGHRQFCICCGSKQASDAARASYRRSVSRQVSAGLAAIGFHPTRSEEHTSELQSLMRISYAVFSLQKTTYTHYTLLTLNTTTT